MKLRLKVGKDNAEEAQTYAGQRGLKLIGEVSRSSRK